MDPDPDPGDGLVRGLQRYVGSVVARLGLTEGGACAHPGPPATAYLAVDGHPPSFPDHDLVLLWDEEYGWAAAVETRDGEAPVVLAYVGGDVLPPASEVAGFVAALLRGERPGDPRPVRLRACGAEDDLVDRLKGYPA